MSHAAVVAAKASPHVATPVAFRPQAGGTDQKPFRRASVKARAHRHGKPAVTRAHGRALGHDKEVSVLPPSRVRGHDLKPAKPGRPANPGSNGQHRGNANSHKPPPKPKKKPPPVHGGGGGGGNGKRNSAGTPTSPDLLEHRRERR